MEKCFQEPEGYFGIQISNWPEKSQPQLIVDWKLQRSATSWWRFFVFTLVEINNISQWARTTRRTPSFGRCISG
jgi:hypothetical protein